MRGANVANSAALDANGIPAGYPFKPALELTPRETRSRLAGAAPGLLLVDCRTGPEWDLVRIDGSIHVPLDELDERADEVAEAAAGREVAVICHHGVRSLKGALLLRERGVPGAKSVAGGIDLWSMAADAGVPRYERGPAGCRIVR